MIGQGRGAKVVDAVNYKNGQKNNWRSRCWNLVSEAIGRDKSKAIVLYLPGSLDLDASIAIRKGFDSCNLIAVERQAKIARVLRKSGRNTINGNLGEVMRSWPDNRRVSVIVADLQCGLTLDAVNILWAWGLFPAFAKSVLVLNMQRGREVYPASASWVTKVTQIAGKNRAIAALIVAGLDFHKKFGSANRGQNPFYFFLTKGDGYLKILPSYRSTPRSPLFDSLVAYRNFEDGLTGIYPDKCTRAKIAAAYAVRTMRITGKLSRAAP